MKTVAAAALLLTLVVVTSLLTGLAGRIGCSGDGGTNAGPTAHARDAIPARYLALYRASSRAYGVPWPVLAAIGAIESDHGRSHARGVHSGMNAFGCCAGPMQFNLRDGPPSTWQRFRLDGNRDGVADVYDPADAIPSAARYLRALLATAGGNLERAILGYNHSSAYVADVLARARTYADRAPEQLVAAAIALPGIDCADGSNGPSGPASLQRAERRSFPRAYRALPAWAMAGGRLPQRVDARLYPDTLWLLRRYRLRVRAAREAGHQTHGDGTALDLVPADPSSQAGWDQSAGRLARDLGWVPACGESGSRPACPLVPAIQFVGYDGYAGHGSPRTCRGGTCPSHLHVSFVSPCFGTSELAAPCAWVESFAQPSAR